MKKNARMLTLVLQEIRPRLVRWGILCVRKPIEKTLEKREFHLNFMDTTYRIFSIKRPGRLFKNPSQREGAVFKNL